MLDMTSHRLDGRRHGWHAQNEVMGVVFAASCAHPYAANGASRSITVDRAFASSGRKRTWQF